MDPNTLGTIAAEMMGRLADMFPDDATIRNVAICVEVDGFDDDLHHVTASLDDRPYVHAAFLRECAWQVEGDSEDARLERQDADDDD